MFIEELKKMKEECGTMKAELDLLKTRNSQLNSNMKKLNNKTKEIILSKNIACTNNNYVTHEKPVIVYDITTQPPTVISANSEFCKLVGFPVVNIYQNFFFNSSLRSF